MATMKSDVEVCEATHMIGARDVVIITETPPSVDSSTIALCATGRKRGKPNGNLLLSGTKAVLLQGGPGGVGVTNGSSDGAIVIDAHTKGSITLTRGTATIVLDDKGITVEGGDLPVSVTSARGITIDAGEQIQLKVGTSTTLTLKPDGIEMKAGRLNASFDLDVLLKALNMTLQAKASLQAKGAMVSI